MREKWLDVPGPWLGKDIFHRTFTGTQHILNHLPGGPC